MSDRKSAKTPNLRAGGGKRYELIDTVKGIAIALMVMGHCYAPFTHWIFLFHMAVFFLCSGFCWNEIHSRNIRCYGRYVWKQFQKLYIPYLLCNGIFLFLNNTLISLGIYTADTDFLTMGVDVSTNAAAVMLDVKGILIRFIQIVFMVGGTQLGGPAWFFAVLYLVCIVFTGICTLFKYSRMGKRKAYFILGLIAVSCFVLVLLRYIEIPVQEFIQRDVLGFLLYVTGILIRQIYDWINQTHNAALLKNRIGCIICFILCILLLYHLDGIGSISIATGKYVNILYLFTCSLAGWGMLYSFSCLLPLRIRKPLAYLGKHTRLIVCLHMLSFKAVTLAAIAAFELPHIMLAIFPALETPEYLWPVYTAAGLAVPLLIETCWKKMIRKTESQEI